MQRRRLAVPCLVLLALAAPASARAQSTVTLGVKVASCSIGATPDDRTAVFTGSMPATASSRTLAMRFTLKSRTGDAAFRTLDAPSFGAWQRSRAGVGALVLDKRVEQLAAGRDYRVVVDFRWTSRTGKTVKRAQRTSPICEQPDVRPALRVAAIAPVPGSGYDVSVVNDGPGDVETAFAVALTVAGIAQAAPPPITTLPAGQTAVVRIAGPDCASGAALTATADPDGVVDEANRADDVLTVTCP